MNTPDHTPACAESPHFCICSTSRPGSITPAGEKPKIMEPLSHPGLVTMDNITVDPDTANLFTEPGSLVADGGWGRRQDHLTVDELPEIRVARGGIKYPSAYELLPKVRAERDTALESKRFWRRTSAWLAAAIAFGTASDLGHWLGWW